MRTNRLFWGLVIILLGVLLLLQSLGILPWNAWAYFWPLFLILLGVWFLFGPKLARGKQETENLAIPLEGSSEAAVEFNHGAGRLLVGGSASPANLLEGSFVGGVKTSLSRSGFSARVKLSADPVFVPFGIPWNVGPEGYRWEVRLQETIPLSLVFHTGAGESLIDLRRLKVSKVSLETGASSTEMTLPENAGFTRVDVKAGAASVVVRVPPDVAGRISIKSGLVGSRIDTMRFPMTGSIYETPGFESATNRVEIYVEAGAGSIEVTSA